jgi:3-oxoacyl-[acyl-carrier protein] reductase
MTAPGTAGHDDDTAHDDDAAHGEVPDGTGSGRPVALVSGGSRGIGREVVATLARDGYDVALCYRTSTDAAKEVAREAAAAGARTLAMRVEVTDGARVREFVAAAQDTLGPFGTVVTSAGVVRDAALALMADDQWREVVGTNLDGTYNVCRAAIPSLMKRRGGCLVTVSSIAGVHGAVGQANYAASKAGIIGLTRTIAKEYGKFGVRANVVAPGFIETDMTEAVPERAKKQYLRKIPIGRFGTPRDVADLISFLVSDRAGFITGQVLGIDGGMVL